MGKGRRERPARLGSKLSEIRKSMNLSQNELLYHLGLSDSLSREEISAYERGVREPSLLTLLIYAKTAGVWLDVLVDDSLDLPNKLPSKVKSEGVRRTSTRRSRNL